MKTLMTVLLAMLNVTFGVRIGSAEKEKNAASFYLLDSNSCYVLEESYESYGNNE